MATETSLLTYWNYVQKWLWCYRLPIVFSVAYLIFTSYAMLHFLHMSKLGDRYWKTGYERMLGGNAIKPFVYRVLIPKISDIIADITPDSWQVAFGGKAYPFFEAHVLPTLPGLKDVYPDSESFYRRMATTLIIYGCLWGFVFALRALSFRLFPVDPAIAWFAPIFAMLIIPSFSYPWQYVYDIPVLFLASICYACLAAERFRWYLFFFILACINKETAIFIPVFFIIWFFRRMELTRYIELAIIQLLIYAIIRYTITYVFQDAAGPVLEDNFLKVLYSDVFSRSSYFRILSIALMFFLLTFRWPDKPLFLKYGLWLFPCIYLAYLLFGRQGEYRVFFDFMPFAVLLGTHTLIAGTGISQSPFFKDNPQKGSS